MTTGRKAARTAKTHAIVADQIRRQIVSGELAEGEHLPSEEDLTVQFGVARTTLREALRVLESQGLIAIRRGRGGGPVVTHPDLGPVSTALSTSLQIQGVTVGDLDAARRLMETEIAGQLARHHSSDDLNVIQAAVDQAAGAAERNDPLAFGLAAAGVHSALVERSGNTTLTTLSQLLDHMVRAYYTRNREIDQRLMRRAVRGYNKLLDLIRAGDEAGAVEHWDASMRYTVAIRDPDASLTSLSPDDAPDAPGART
ncbi:MAG: FadR family transcriptional regulator [Acidimicrobiales bacterium]|nr:FadR family transcriptional regulator [Acidimicrobiales bacterium]